MHCLSSSAAKVTVVTALHLQVSCSCTCLCPPQRAGHHNPSTTYSQINRLPQELGPSVRRGFVRQDWDLWELAHLAPPGKGWDQNADLQSWVLFLNAPLMLLPVWIPVCVRGWLTEGLTGIQNTTWCHSCLGREPDGQWPLEVVLGFCRISATKLEHPVCSLKPKS